MIGCENNLPAAAVSRQPCGNRVFQRTKTDCLTAAIATVTGLLYEECPQLWPFTAEEWLGKMREWASSKGLGLAYFDLKDRISWPWLEGFDVIVGGSTTRSSDYFHCIVARAECRDGKTILHYIHDPMMGGDFIIEPDHCIFFVPATTTEAGES